jgi:hypothetical protein
LRAHSFNFEFCSLCTQAAFVQSILKKYYVATARTAPKELTYQPAQPTGQWPPEFEAYCLKPVTFCFPHREFPSIVTRVPCPVALCSHQPQLKSYSRPRWVYGLHGMELFVSSVHYCSSHKKEYQASEVLHLLPAPVRNALPVILNASSGVTKRCERQLFDGLGLLISFSAA